MLLGIFQIMLHYILHFMIIYCRQRRQSGLKTVGVVGSKCTTDIGQDLAYNLQIGDNWEHLPL